MDIRENVPLAPYTTFKVGGPARYLLAATTEQELIEGLVFARERSLPVFVLGGGSNLVVADAGWPGLVLHVQIRAIESHSTGNGWREFTVGAGEDWDAFVAHTVAENCAGIECMSGIPGTVGGTPVQNVGAYGQEVSETIVSVRVVELATCEAREMTNAECGFAYRRSIFNSSEKGRWIVTQVRYSLLPGGAPPIEYADLKRHFAGNSQPTLQQVRDAVRAIRASKGMLIVPGDPDCRSAGSFFKNPIVSKEKHDALTAAQASERVPAYPAAEGVKLSAAWLVERSGFPKGFTHGNVGMSSKHSLAIVNRGGATASEILELKTIIQNGVRRAFGIELEPEPVFVGF